MDGRRWSCAEWQDGVGNTMNAGPCTCTATPATCSATGCAAQGAREGDVGYRVGIHMKAYESLMPIVVCGGKARDFFGEYMAGGMLVLLACTLQFPDQRSSGPSVGPDAWGNHLRSRQGRRGKCGKEVGVMPADEDDMAILTPVLREWCEAFGIPSTTC